MPLVLFHSSPSYPTLFGTRRCAPAEPRCSGKEDRADATDAPNARRSCTRRSRTSLSMLHWFIAIPPVVVGVRPPKPLPFRGCTSPSDPSSSDALHPPAKRGILIGRYPLQARPPRERGLGSAPQRSSRTGCGRFDLWSLVRKKTLMDTQAPDVAPLEPGPPAPEPPTPEPEPPAPEPPGPERPEIVSVSG